MLLVQKEYYKLEYFKHFTSNIACASTDVFFNKCTELYKTDMLNIWKKYEEFMKNDYKSILYILIHLHFDILTCYKFRDSQYLT